MAAKKKATPKPKSSLTSISLTKNELRIPFENSHDLMNKLFHVTQHVANLHASQSLVAGDAARANVLARFSPADTQQLLGFENASAIVSSCAGNNDGNTALGDIPALDLRVFQNCVQRGIISAHFQPPQAIPASPSNTLDDVIKAIAGSTSK